MDLCFVAKTLIFAMTPIIILVSRPGRACKHNDPRPPAPPVLMILGSSMAAPCWVRGQPRTPPPAPAGTPAARRRRCRSPDARRWRRGRRMPAAERAPPACHTRGGGSFSSHPLSFYMENTSVHRKVCRRMDKQRHALETGLRRRPPSAPHGPPPHGSTCAKGSITMGRSRGRASRDLSSACAR